MKRATLLLFTLLLASCSGGGRIKTPLADMTHPLSLLGKQRFKSYYAKVHPDGTVETRITGYATHNPDPDLTKGVVSGVKAKILGDVTKHITTETGLTTRHVDDNAVKINATNKTAETEQLSILNPPPEPAAP